MAKTLTVKTRVLSRLYWKQSGLLEQAALQDTYLPKCI